MSRGELKAHHDAVRKCMDGMGLSKCEDGMSKAEMEDAAKDAQGYRPNGGPHDGEAAKSKTAPASDATALEKSEKNVVIEEVVLLKSELEATKAKSEDYKKNLDAVEAFLKKFVEKTAPAGKAITSLDIIAKTEGGKEEKPLSKSEIDAKLLAKAKDHSLSKSDRDAINSYYFSKNIESVRHLLT
jgi:seryl-tRNA synthetase